MLNFIWKYNNIKPKTKNSRSFDHIYNSRKWVIFAFDDQVIIEQQNYSLLNKLDDNWQNLFLNTKINKKILIVGEYIKVNHIYWFLKKMNKKVYACYI